ncbi:MAG TPA: NAD(P)/FAD-dependent oxidoreductase [Thermoleophilaceae bacterium]|nr:NAD(P)/FAD-dependent oxidoreductase [Thermoleophilaceae bacterium]
MSDRFDAVVVGASVAGCTAAHLLGRAGARVALVEQRPDPDAYKVVCTHAILSSGSPTIARLGIEPALEARGAVRIHGDGWTPFGGWIRAPDDAPRGWGVTRRTLDPLLRESAAEVPGVELLVGHTATDLLADASGRPAGVATETREHHRHELRAPLVVAADGRHSPLARMAGVRGRVLPNGRFAYWAYWGGVPPTNRARVWFLEPDGAAHFPNEDGLTLLAAVGHRSRLAEFRADLEGVYERYVSDLPDGPELGGAERVSKVIGAIDHENVIRPAARPGIAFVGDAALAADPLFGVGLSWALQSGEWLADAVAPALLGDGDLDAALRRYARRFRRRLAPHHVLMSDFSSGRPATPIERAMSRAAARNRTLARAFDDTFSRRRSPFRLLDPRLAPHFVRGLFSP